MVRSSSPGHGPQGADIALVPVLSELGCACSHLLASRVPAGTWSSLLRCSEAYPILWDWECHQYRTRLLASYTGAGEGLRLPNIRSAACALPLAFRLTLSRSIDHVREFFTRAIKE